MQFIGKKAAYALSQNIKVIACIGELLEEREAGKTFDVCFKQMKAFAGAIFHLKYFFMGILQKKLRGVDLASGVDAYATCICLQIVFQIGTML